MTTRPARPSLRSHTLFMCALALGVAIRGLVISAYRPALLFTDSFSYLRSAQDLNLSPTRPIGYSFFLRPFVLGFGDEVHALTAIQIAQHVIGLALAVLVYAFLRRRGLPGWGATLATLPLLLDPLQLVLEHYVLSDVLFSALLVVAVVVMFWNHRPGWAAVTTAGVLLGAMTLVRGAGTFTVIAFLVALAYLRVPWRRVVAFLVAFAIPIAGYATAFERQHGEFATSTGGQLFLYSRLASIVDCHDPQLRLTPRMRRLCPAGGGEAARRDANYYMWSPDSPIRTVAPPQGLTREQFLRSFNKQVIRSQPLTIASATLKDLARGFHPLRTYESSGYLASNWLFADDYWMREVLASKGYQDPILDRVSAEPGAAGFLAHYRRYVYLPGPLAALLLLVALVAALGFGRARHCGDRVLIGLLAGSCLVILLTGAALSGFSWRYQLPQIALVPMAGALGLAALARGPATGKPAPMAPVRPLDRGAELLARLPLGQRARAHFDRATAAGRIQWLVALLIATIAAVVVILGGLASGYLRLPFAGLIGVGTGVLVFLALIVGRARGDRERQQMES